MNRAALIAFCLFACGAEAKDVQRSPSPDAAKGCEWAGPGFAKLDGSETCVKLSGGVRAEFSTSKASDVFAPSR